MSSEIAAQACRGLPAELAAKLVVKVSMHFAAVVKSSHTFYGMLDCLDHLTEINFACTASSKDNWIER